MNKHNDGEIVAFCKSLWDGCGGLDGVQIKVAQNKDLVVITISAMYSAPGFSFDKLEALAKFFNTKNIETESEFSHHGCESCDYGSDYGFDLYVREGVPYVVQP